MRKKTLFLLGLSFVCVTSFAIRPSSDMTREQYIRKYYEWAIKNMKKNGVPASITLAQGILESRSGNSRLAREGNNHFGIKCHDWTGERIYEHDDRRNECFRKYDSAYESFADHARFLSTRSRYSDLFELEVTDYKKWARGLKKAGYATDPNYAHRLITIIENHNLDRFDKGVKVSRRSGKSRESYEVNPFTQHEVHYNNGVRYVRVKSGDTFSAIAEEFDLRDWELPTYNDLPSGDHEATDFSYLYIERKRNNAHPDHDQHVVKEGQTMFEISQIYGVKLKRLYKLNEMPEGKEPRPGDRIELR